MTDEAIAETSSKETGRKWNDRAVNCWYKLDQFDYGTLGETAVSTLLGQGNLETDTLFIFACCHMKRLLTNHLVIPFQKKLLLLFGI